MSIFWSVFLTPLQMFFHVVTLHNMLIMHLSFCNTYSVTNGICDQHHFDILFKSRLL